MVAGVEAGGGGQAQQKDGSRGYTVSTNKGQTLASTSTTDHCMYTLMYTPLGYNHSVHSFTRSGLPSWTGDGFRYKHILQRVECLVVDTAGQGARPISSRRASRQPPPPGFGASAAPHPRHQYVTYQDADAGRCAPPPSGGPTPLLAAGRAPPWFSDGARDGGVEVSLVPAQGRAQGQQGQRQATRTGCQPYRASLSPILILKCSSATCWPSLRPRRRPGLLLPLLSPLMLHHTQAAPPPPPATHHARPAPPHPAPLCYINRLLN